MKRRFSFVAFAASIACAVAVLNGCGSSAQPATAEADGDPGVSVQCADGRPFSGSPDDAAEFCLDAPAAVPSRTAPAPLLASADDLPSVELLVRVTCCGGGTCTGEAEDCAAFCKAMCEKK